MKNLVLIFTKPVKHSRFFALALCLLTLAVSSGCSRITVLRTTELHAVRDSLNLELAKVMREQQVLLDEMKTGTEMLRLLRADQQIRFDEINRRVMSIESGIQESHQRISRLDRQTTEVNRRIEQRIASEQDAAQQRVLQIERLFEIAMGDFNAGRFDLAIGSFQDIVRQFPDSPQAKDSEYWLAEAHFAKRSYETAEKLYFEFMQNNPTSPHFCAVLYKLGLSYERQEKTRSRDMAWNNLLERCEDSPEAQAVRAQQ